MYTPEQLDAMFPENGDGQDEQHSTTSQNLTSDSVENAEQHAPQSKAMSPEEAMRYVLKGDAPRYGQETFDENDYLRSQAEDKTSRFVRGAMRVVSSIPKALAEFGSATVDGYDPELHPYYQAGRALDEWVLDNFQINPAYNNDLTSHLSDGAGSIAGTLAGGAFGRLLKLPAAIGGAVMGGTTISVEGVEDYLRTVDEQGLEADLEERKMVALYNGIQGAVTEGFSIWRIFNRIDRITQGGIRKNIKHIAKEGAWGSVEEATTEVLQSVAQNLIASDVVGYDPDRRPITDETIIGGEVGSILGFFVSAGAAAIGVKRVNKKLNQVVNEMDTNQQAMDAVKKRRDDALKNGEPADTVADIEQELEELKDRQHDLEMEKSVLDKVVDTGESDTPPEVPEGSEEMADEVGEETTGESDGDLAQEATVTEKTEEEDSQPGDTQGVETDPEAATGSERPIETIGAEPAAEAVPADERAVAPLDGQSEPDTVAQEEDGSPSGTEGQLGDRLEATEEADPQTGGDHSTLPDNEAGSTESLTTEPTTQNPQPTTRNTQPTYPQNQDWSYGDTVSGLSEGQQADTRTGRKTTAFPRVGTGNKGQLKKTRKRINQWLIDNASAEADSRGDEFNGRMFRAMQADNMSPADRDHAESYLFDGDSADPVPPNVPEPSAGQEPSADKEPVAEPETATTPVQTPVQEPETADQAPQDPTPRTGEVPPSAGSATGAPENTDQPEAKTDQPTAKPKQRTLRSKKRNKKRAELSEEEQKVLQDMKDLMDDSFGKGGTLGMNIDPVATAKLMAQGAKLGRIYLEKGYLKFADWADSMLDALGERIEPLLQELYGSLKSSPHTPKELRHAMDDTETVAEFDMDSLYESEETDAEPEAHSDANLINALAERLKTGGFENNRALKQFIADQQGIQVRDIADADLKHYQELTEAAMTTAIGPLVGKAFVKDHFDRVVRMYQQLPLLNVRTSDSVERQAYSTPAPLSWIASAYTMLTHKHSSLDNTAGNGALLAGANREKAIVNELDPLRVQNLRHNGFTVSNLNAVGNIQQITGGKKVDRVLVNPPFAKLAKPIEKDGYQIVKLDHQLAAEALDAMKDDGKAVLIVGATKERGGMTDSERPFFNWLYSHYNVVDHFEVDGKLYERMGAKWPVRMLVIDGRVKSEKFAPPNGTVERIDSWEGLYERYQRYSQGNESDNGVLGTDNQPAPGTDDGPQGGGRSNDPRIAAGKTGDEAGDAAGQRDGAGVGRGTDTGAGTGQSGRAGSRRDGAGTEREAGDAGATDSVGPGGRKNTDPKSGSQAESARANAEQLAANAALASDYQVPYQATSAGFNEGILTPRNLGEAIHEALSSLQTQLGTSLDAFVAEQLGYGSVNDLHKGLMGLQVDAVAASIFNIKRGQAVVIADQTGVGKGRQAAAILRYALEHELTPVFITVDPALYNDMWRDLTDIGETRIKPFIFNENRGIEVENALGEKETLFSRRGSARRHALELLEKKGRLPEGTNAVFVSYPQLNKMSNRQQRALGNIMDNALLVMDEAHKAAGDSNTGTYFRDLVQQARGTVFLSATWAKRPDNVPLYGVTSLGQAVTNVSDLPDIMQTGGLPLQTIVSNMLAREGQLFRRERSFKGIEFKTKILGHDSAVEKARQVQVADTLTGILRGVVHANSAFLNLDVKAIKQKLQKETGGSASGSGNNKASTTVNAAPFTSVSHNAIANMLYLTKLDVAVDEAIAAFKRGEKPFLVVDKTFGSFHDDFVSKRKLTAGNEVDDFGFHHVLERMVDRSRTVTIRDRTGKEMKVMVPMAELNPATRELYNEVYQSIEEARSVTDDLPGSPIDYLYQKLTDAGLRVGEITGRQWLFQQRDGKTWLEPRTDTNKTGIVQSYNSGELDALIVNRSGSTGLSMHASEKFADQKVRHMIVLEADLDINQFMQMLGRINRHGQVQLPLYTLLQLTLPAEKRLAAILAMKMQSLNANTSSDTESDNSLKQVVDMLNKYGDEIVRDFLLSRPDIVADTGFSVSDGAVPQDLAKKFYNRLSLMPVAFQEQVYEEVEPVYQEYIEFLDKTHQNELKPKVLDLDARVLERRELVPKKPGSSVFSAPVMQDKLNVKLQGKPPRHDEVQAAVDKATAEKSASQQLHELVAEMGQDKGYIRKIEDKISRIVQQLENPEQLDDKKRSQLSAELMKLKGQKEQYDRQEQQLTNYWLPQMTLGSWTRIRLEGTPTVAVVTGIQYRHSNGQGNPFSPSKLSVRFLVNNVVRQVQLPLSKLLSGEAGDRLFMGQLSAHEIRPEEIFTGENRGGNREERYMITENLLQGVMESERRGQVVSYTDEHGKVQQGYLLPRNFDPATDVKDTVNLQSMTEVMAYIAKAREVGGDALRIGLRTRRKGAYVALNADSVELVAPKSKRAGHDIWGNQELLAITGDFVSRGETMRVTVGNDKAEAALAQFMTLEPLFIPRTLKPVLDQALGRQNPDDSQVRFSRTDKPKRPMKASRVKSAIADTARAFKPKVRVVQSVNELPEHVLAKAGQHSDGADGIQAVYDPDTGKQGTFWMVADHLANPAEARRKLIHEATHYGLRRFLKDPALLNRTLRQIGRDIPADDLKRIADGYELNLNKREDYLEAVEEVLAHYAEHLPEAGWFRRAVAKLRRVMRRLVPSLRWTKNDIHGLLTEARRGAREPVGKKGREAVRLGLDPEMERQNGQEPTAEVFYSALKRNVWLLPMERGTGEQFLKFMLKSPLMKQEEMDWIGLTEYLQDRKNKPVTREEITRYVNDREVVLREVIGDEISGNGNKPTRWFTSSVEDAYEMDKAQRSSYRNFVLYMPEVLTGGSLKPDIYDTSLRYLRNGHVPRNWHIGFADESEAMPTESDAKWLRKKAGKPELVLRHNGSLEVMLPVSDTSGRALIKKAYEYLKNKPEYLTQPLQYGHNHFEQDNTVLFTLTVDRMTPDGKKMLHIEEIQSDWNQNANRSSQRISRRETQRLERTSKTLRRLMARKERQMQQERRRMKRHLNHQEAAEAQRVLDRLQRDLDYLVSSEVVTRKTFEDAYNRDKNVMDPPFRKSWPVLAWKRMLRFAAENGYDGVSWATGEQVALKNRRLYQVQHVAVGIEINNDNVVRFNLYWYEDKPSELSYYSAKKRGQDLSALQMAELLAPHAPELLEKVNIALDDLGLQLDVTGLSAYQAEQYIKENYDLQAKLDDPIWVGGDFYKGVYNNTLPSGVKKQVKGYGAKVETVEVLHGKGDPFNTENTTTRPVHGVMLNDGLKNLALHKGQPLFARQMNQQPQLNPDMRDDVGWMDKLFRLPFRLLGGVDERNRYNPLYKGTEKVIEWGSSRYDKLGEAEKGSFSKWLHTMGEAAAWGMVDQKNVPEDYKVRDAQRKGEANRWVREGMKLIDGLYQSGINARESKLMYDWVVGDVADADPRLQELSEPVKDVMKKMGELAVEYGWITREAFERHKGFYLHRSYFTHEHFDQSRLQRWFDSRMRARRKKVHADTFKGRGKFRAESLNKVLSEINKHAPDWYAQQVKANNPNLEGVTLTVLEKVRSDGKVAHRVYWPEGVAIPDAFSTYTEQPAMKVRAVRESPGKNQLYLYRDYTRAEREQMGEIFDLRYAVARTFHTMANDLAMGHFYKDISEKEEWAVEATAENLETLNWTNPRSRWNTLALVEHEWVRVPTTMIKKAKAYQWGRLAGTFGEDGKPVKESGYLVRSEIWKDLNEIMELNKPTTWRWLMSQYKLNKTARSPVTHMNNIMSNFVLADLLDVRFADIWDALKSMKDRDERLVEAEDYGVFGSSMAEVELREKYLTPLLRELRAANVHTVPQPARQKMALFAALDKVGQALRTADSKATQLYQLEDDLFRMAVYLKRTRIGDSPAEAALAARKQFIDYDIRAPWINSLRQTIMPFLSYNYRIIPLLADAARKRPWKLAKYITIAEAMIMAAYALTGGDEEEEYRALPKHLQGNSSIGIPGIEKVNLFGRDIRLGVRKAIRLPMRDFYGDPMFIDITRDLPGGDVTETAGHGAIEVPVVVQWGGPLVTAIELLFTNKSSFTGQPITNELSDTGMEKAGKMAHYAYQAMMPNWPILPGTHAWNRVVNRPDGGLQSMTNKPYDRATEIINSLGIKARGQNTRANKAMQALENQRYEREIRTGLDNLKRQLRRGDIDRAEFDQGVEMQKGHIKNLKKKIDKEQGRE
ncbi:strawberry notch C-terminal domain-containing protein [Endozoicomonas sp. ALB091]|uniref:strawberry notch C-terminal domain-containing protein n=1 Tax=Endozoicomonas sp. ALB091 TaxID=3403073 RepID=UPI003BB79C12